MKTLFTTLCLATALLAGNAANACGDSTKIQKGFNIHFGDAFGGKFSYWQGLDLGVNGWLNKNHQLGLPVNYDSLELDYSRSWHVAWNITQYNLSLYKKYVSLGTGFGLEWNSYAFRNNILLATDAPVITAVAQDVDFTKNKLKTLFVNVPLLINLNTSEHNRNNFHITAGAKFGYNIFRNKQKLVWDDDGEKRKQIRRDDFLVNPFRYGVTARVGYGKYTVYADYALSTMFRDKKGPQVYPFNLGIHIDL
jgi:hypothetical protein